MKSSKVTHRQNTSSELLPATFATDAILTKKRPAFAGLRFPALKILFWDGALIGAGLYLNLVINVLVAGLLGDLFRLSFICIAGDSSG
jgi:hypothetical protein